jgi:hypothetical protein
VVLARQKRGGRDHCHLSARHGGNKGRAHGHFRLAKAHIAHHQPVHGATALQIREHLFDGAQLVLGLGIGEAGAEFLPHPLGRGQRGGLAQFALGGGADQLVGDFEDALFQLGFARLPCAAAQLVEHPLLVAKTAEKFDVFNRQIQLVAAAYSSVRHSWGAPSAAMVSSPR